MEKKYKYDVAISFAEEDRAVAESIAVQLGREKICYYLYDEHQAEQLGNSIRELIPNIYGCESKLILMIISADYKRKYWTQIETRIALLKAKQHKGCIVPVRKDNTHIDGISGDVVFVEWQLNPIAIAGLVAKKLKRERKLKNNNFI